MSVSGEQRVILCGLDRVHQSQVGWMLLQRDAALAVPMEERPHLQCLEQYYSQPSLHQLEHSKDLLNYRGVEIQFISH
jgi:hypothetical protein